MIAGNRLTPYAPRPENGVRSVTMKVWASLLCGGMALAAEASDGVGWNNQGRGDFADAKPPPKFSGATGEGIRWKVALPNWSNSSPIVVDTDQGPRVLLLAEPLDYAPFLLCYDARTGEELWRRELDPVPLLPAAEQDEARALARRLWTINRLRKRLTTEIHALYLKDKAAFTGREYPAEAAPLVAAAAEAGFEYSGIGQSAGGYANYLRVPHGGGKFRAERHRLQGLGLVTSEWDYQGTWDGVAYPTPISDGQRVWTVTMHNLCSCHDLEGRTVWQVRFPPPTAQALTEDQKRDLAGADGKLRWPGGWPGQGGFSTSPIMAEGKLVSCAGSMVRCLDAATGATLWAQPMLGQIGQALGVPAFLVADGERLVVGIGNEGGAQFKEPQSAIYRLKDGQRVALLPGVTSSKGGVSAPVTDGDLVINRPAHEDGALTAHRARRVGEAWRMEEVWRLPKSAKREEAISLFRPAWRDGRLYNGGSVLDLREGKWLAARRGPVNPGYYGQGGILIGPVFFSWDFYGGSFVWVNAATGAKVGEGSLPVNPPDGKPLDFKREQACLDHWRWLGAATPFAHGDRLYIRAYDFLWCIGNPAPAPLPPEAVSKP
jgi:outer membrane protein assembly factor BamB